MVHAGDSSDGRNVAAPRRRSPPGAQTAGRTLDVLEVAARSTEPVTVGAIVSLLGIPRGAAYRSIRALQSRGLLARHPQGRGYVVGSGVIALSAAVLGRFPLRAVARPFMENIARLTTETVSLHVRHFDQRICIEVIEGTHRVRRLVALGETLPIYAGPTGKVMLAFISDRERDSVVDLAADAGADPQVLADGLHEIHDRGYTITIGDRTPGIGAISVPLFGAADVCGALTVSGPATRWHGERIEGLADAILRECSGISLAMGHLPGAVQIDW